MKNKQKDQSLDFCSYEKKYFVIKKIFGLKKRDKDN